MYVYISCRTICVHVLVKYEGCSFFEGRDGWSGGRRRRAGDDDLVLLAGGRVLALEALQMVVAVHGRLGKASNGEDALYHCRTTVCPQ